MLDHPKNDIFIHMDAKNKSYNPDQTLTLVKHSRLFHIPRRKVTWGAYSQLEAVLSLFEYAASTEHYEHYHILSGACLPIKKQDELIDFFEHHHGIEFVCFESEQFHEQWRVNYYQPFIEFQHRAKNPLVKLFFRVLSKICRELQKLLHIRRNKTVNFQKGEDWYSISDELVRYMLSKRDWIRKVFHDTPHPAESCIHTLVINSHFRNHLYNAEAIGDREKSAVRLIDWSRGHDAHPHVFRMSDLEMIQNSKAMFARKFMPSVDAEIIQKIKELYS
ncbi:MAG: hypothetical protein IJP54_08785 [Synergistaceae bacterium]|nr:hypothetical protein [Synergistaceae bacterium]